MISRALEPLLRRAPRTRRGWLGLGALVSTFALIGIVATVIPRPPSQADVLDAYVAAHAQSITVPEEAVPIAVLRDTYGATPGIATLAAGGTNHDWAKLVLVLGGWPMTESNVTVLTRWMRQENGPDDWFNRNNPLNNGWGSGGGGGLGSYDNLVIAAENAAEALHSNPGYSAIIVGLAASAPTEVIEAAIWASPWATGHYANGSHWSYVPVPVVKAPDGSW